MSKGKMTDAQVQRKLNQLARISQELHDEAIRRYGHDGKMYYEAEGSFHFMSHDNGGSISERQDGVVMSSHVACLMDCGGW